MGWQRKAFAYGAVMWTSGVVLAGPAGAQDKFQDKQEWYNRMTAVGQNGSCNGASASSSGHVVSGVQANLWATDHLANTSDVDNYYGPNTHNAMASFQSTHGMSVTGCLAGVTPWYQFQRARFPGGNDHFILMTDQVNYQNWKYRGASRVVAWQWSAICEQWLFKHPGTGTYVSAGSWGFDPQCTTSP